MMIIMFFAISLIIPIILMIINSYVFKKNVFKRNKPTPFECGFDQKNSARIPFSLRFFLISIIFLIFDIEITLLLPIPVAQKYFNPISWTLMFLFFLFVLILGLYHEWNQGALNWSK